MKILRYCFLILFFINQLNAQEIEISKNLILQQISKDCYVHTQGNNNGLIYINNGEALIISTPDSDAETQNLIDWVTDEKKTTIVAWVIDRWHPDAMGGLHIVKGNNIQTYSFTLTQQIAREKELPVPEIGFNPKIKIKVGKKKIICQYFGEAHTSDGIVVWIPSEKILFGGNEIRNFNGWIGNIGDANLAEWAETIEKVKKKYGSAGVVIPGHGKYGGPELIDYTIDLYKPFKDISYANSGLILDPDLKTNEEFLIFAESDIPNEGKKVLENVIMIVQDTSKYMKIESPKLIYQPENKRVDSEEGHLQIFDKTPDGELLRTDLNYQKLIIIKINESVGYAVILKGATVKE